MAERLAIPKSWNLETKPHKFCPGCGHGLVLKVLGEVIDELEIQDRLVFGVDIGCSLLAYDFFDVDTVQTHHGRTNPVMVGIKRANPELLAIAYMGDGGGYAIGSQHLVNSAFRNEKIMAIVVNNCNYGMTGGQMSPTTLPGQKTETSPYGRDPKETGNPTLGPEMVAAIASPGAYVARASVSNMKQLKRFMKKAVENQIAGNGFSFLEVISSCPTNWRTNAKQTWAFMEEDMAAYFKTGELRTPDESKEG
jgi:2-oxoglutarate ferredoxin oxidoreductase subunit beta